MFIKLTNYHNAFKHWFNTDNIVTFGEGTLAGCPATYIETVNHNTPYAEPYFVKETPEMIEKLIKESGDKVLKVDDDGNMSRLFTGFDER